MLADRRDMEPNEHEIFDGVMLSDGGLEKKHNGKSARFSSCVKYPEFRKIIEESLPSIPWSGGAETDRHDSRTGKTYHSCPLRSRCSEELTREWMRWYPKGSKRVPNDIKITPTVLLWWYLGDGSLHRKKSRPNYRRISLSTDSFSATDQSLLIWWLTELLGPRIYPENGKIMIGQQAMAKATQLLGTQSPVQCYQYKFDFGQYLNPDYKKISYAERPLAFINEFRKRNKVRELHYINKETIEKAEDYIYEQQ